MKKKRFLKPAALFALIWSAFALPAAQAQDFVWAPDLPVGASIPAIEAPDQNGAIRQFDDLVGERGLLLMFSRSFDW